MNFNIRGRSEYENDFTFFKTVKFWFAQKNFRLKTICSLIFPKVLSCTKEGMCLGQGGGSFDKFCDSRRFYLFCFLDYQMNYYEVLINSNKDYGARFDYHIYIYIYDIYIYMYIIYIYISYIYIYIYIYI